MVTKKAPSYGLEPRFEKIVTCMLALSPEFFSRVGEEINPKMLDVPECKLIADATRSIAREHSPPSTPLVVIQRLRRWQQEGKVKHEEVLKCADLIDHVACSTLPDVDSLVSELAPILRRALHTEAVREIMQEFSNHGDMVKIEEKLSRARRIGVAESSNSITMGVDSFKEIRALRYTERLSFGVFELDRLTDGGLWRGALGTVISGFGGGKSLVLSQIASQSFLDNYFVGLVTLELACGLVFARIKANLTGVPTNMIISGEGEDLAMDRLNNLVFEKGCQGRFTMSYMNPGSAPEEVERWVIEEEKRARRKMDVVIIDYADELRSSDERDRNDYSGMKTVYRRLESIAKNEKDPSHKRWCWTASQAKRKDKSQKRVTGNDIADSINKMRVVDMGVGVTLSEDQSTADFSIEKYRLGRAGTYTGPLPVELECGRIGPVMREAS
jgi:hypothetical protein